MQTIMFRALVALSLLGVVGGGSLSTWAWFEAKSEGAALGRFYEISHADNEKCEADAKDNFDKKMTCTDGFVADLKTFGQMKASIPRLRTPFYAGFWIIGISLFLWPLFFIGRWIFTGRLRGMAKAAA